MHVILVKSLLKCMYQNDLAVVLQLFKLFITILSTLSIEFAYNKYKTNYYKLGVCYRTNLIFLLYVSV